MLCVSHCVPQRTRQLISCFSAYVSCLWMWLLFRWAQRRFVSFCAGSGGGGICVCLGTCLTCAKYKHTCTHIHVCMHAHTCTHMHACTHTQTHACTCTHTLMHTNMRTHTHTHITSSHLHLLPPPSPPPRPPYTLAKTVFIAIHGKFMKKWLYICCCCFSVVSWSTWHVTCKTMFTLHIIFCAQHTWCSFDVDI